MYSLLDVGDTTEGYYYPFQCPNGLVPIGFGARSSCYSLKDFKVIFGLSVEFARIQQEKMNVILGLTQAGQLLIPEQALGEMWFLYHMLPRQWHVLYVAIKMEQGSRPTRWNLKHSSPSIRSANARCFRMEILLWAPQEGVSEICKSVEVRTKIEQPNSKILILECMQ